MKKTSKNVWVYVARAFQVAYDVAGGLFLGVICGIYLDKFFKTKALFIVLLSLWGIIHGFRAMIHLGDDK